MENLQRDILRKNNRENAGKATEGEYDMTLDDVKGHSIREKIFPIVLEEACRQWCEWLEETPERKSGEGFSDFFFEIFEQKELDIAADYLQNSRKTEVNRKERTR